jgi:hypothetical protein
VLAAPRLRARRRERRAKHWGVGLGEPTMRGVLMASRIEGTMKNARQHLARGPGRNSKWATGLWSASSRALSFRSVVGPPNVLGGRR